MKYPPAMRRMAVYAVLLIGSVCATVALGETAPAFTMRLDDNKSPAEWREICGIFERHGMRCSLAVVSASLTAEQGACLKELAGRGHVLMDHTPNHWIYTIVYPDAASFETARQLPFVHDFDAASRRVNFTCNVDAAHPLNRKVRAKVIDNQLVFVGKSVRLGGHAYLGLPGRTEVFGILPKKDGMNLLDFWRRPLKEKLNLPEADVVIYDEVALQPCDDLVRELAKVTRERFDHFGLPRPTIWVKPGGWSPAPNQLLMKRIYGDEFGYIGADSRVGPAKFGSTRWSTGYDAMYFFDQGPDVTPEKLVDMVEAKLKSGQYFVLLSHMWTSALPGGWKEFVEKTERFTALLETRKIRSVTMDQLLKERFP